MTRKPRLLFYFLHLLGVGHVYRAKRLIEGFAQQGIDVDVIYGGEPVGETFDSTSTHYLPPIRVADASYATYLDGKGDPLDESFMKQRQSKLLSIFDVLYPDLILIEAFPFGRRVVRHELKAMLEAAGKREKSPLVVSSVRDILQERKKPGRMEETLGWVQNSFDHVLVHSDPKVIRLDETFPLADKIADKLSYTGFVVPEATTAESVPTFDVIATAGGGGFGSGLLQIVMEAAQDNPISNAKWCLATGPHMPEKEIAKLKSMAPDHVTIVERLNNLTAHLAKAKISISQCGYNTAMDVLSAHHASDCRAVFVPYDTQGQSEQLRRAEILEKAGYAINLPQSKLTKEALLNAIERAARLPKVDHQIDFDGVANTANLVRHWLDERSVT